MIQQWPLVSVLPWLGLSVLGAGQGLIMTPLLNVVLDFVDAQWQACLGREFELCGWH